MTQYLPQNLLALFAPRDPIPYMPPPDKLPTEKPNSHVYEGVGQLLAEFEDPKDTPPPTRVETKDERKERKRKERAEQVAYKLEQDLALWDPTNDVAIAGDPFKTLFVARINYDTSESKLRREFEVYGPVKRINVAHNSVDGKPRGFAFIEYEHERDMHSAYKHADGKKIDGRRVLVDVERGRTVKGWRPRRLGGGLGGTRRGGPDMNSKYSGREENANRDRSRSRSRDTKRRKSRSKSREPRRDRRRRSRSRERPKRRSRSRERRRSKDRDEERKRRRSRSKERTRRSRSKDKKRRRSRSRDRKRRSRDRNRGEEEENTGNDAIKQEKISGMTPPHDPDTNNGYNISYPTNEGEEEGEYNEYNGEPNEEMQQQIKSEGQEGEYGTNEYGSME